MESMCLKPWEKGVAARFVEEARKLVATVMPLVAMAPLMKFYGNLIQWLEG